MYPMIENSTPLVSISCVTYNHVQFIRKCLDGFLMQQTSFPFEIVIHDDCSTDGTREIIEEYADKHPNIFFPMFQQENQFSKGIRGMMLRYNFPRCRGKYIALCEGDDYWVDPLKLQKQVDIFEKYPDTVICGTRSKTWNEELQKIVESTPPIEIKETNFTVEDFFDQKIWIKTCTRMIKKDDLLSIPLKYQVDYLQVNYLIAKKPKGRIVVLPDTTTVYREHKGGVYTSKSQIQKNISNFNVNLDLAELYEGQKKKTILKYSRKLARSIYKTKSLPFGTRLYYFVECFRLNPKLTILELFS